MKPLALLFALTFSACQLFGPEGNAADRIVLEASFDATDRAVDLRLINRSINSVGYNLCFSDVTSVETGAPLPRANGVCTADIRGLEPQGSIGFRILLDPDSTLASGSYQAATSIEVGGERREIRSDSFGIP